MATAEPGNAPALESESDFEYEYTDETEDFYFTLDVTTHGIPTASTSAQPNTGKKIKGKHIAPPPEQLQVLDLHSDNPLIKLGDSSYSCHWSTDLGTQFYVAKRGMIEEPLRPGHVLDVIGVSRARLTGKPVSLHRRDRKTSTKAVGSSATNAIVLDDTEDRATGDAVPGNMSASQYRSTSKNINRLSTVRNRARDPNVKAQASFLERLAMIKQRKGETDKVPVDGIEELSGLSHSSEIANSNVSGNGKRTSAADGPLDLSGGSSLIDERRLPVAEGTGDGEGVSTRPAASDSNTDSPLQYPVPSGDHNPSTDASPSIRPDIHMDHN